MSERKEGLTNDLRNMPEDIRRSPKPVLHAVVGAAAFVTALKIFAPAPEAADQRPAYRTEDSDTAIAPKHRAETAGEIKRIQKELKIIGYDPGPFDGTFGKRTRAAVDDFKDDFMSGEPDGLTPRTIRSIHAVAADKVHHEPGTRKLYLSPAESALITRETVERENRRD